MSVGVKIFENGSVKINLKQLHNNDGGEEPVIEFIHEISGENL